MLESLKKLSKEQSVLTEYVANCKKGTLIKNDIMKKNITKYINSLENTDLTSYIIEKTKGLLEEVNDLLNYVEAGDLKKVSKFVNQTKYLFHGATGVRHVDFIGYKQPDKK